MATKQDPDISENYLHDEYTDDELNREHEAAQRPGTRSPFAPGVHTGGTLAGDTAAGGSPLDQGDRSFVPGDRPVVHGWDSIGDEVAQDPAMEGTVAGNTNAAQSLVGGPEVDRTPQTPEEDLGPEGAIVQELGGEARY